jgi:hypothetical protein
MGERMKIKDVDLTRRSKLRGDYSAYCTCCEACGNSFRGGDGRNFLGFSEWKGDVVILQECKKCFSIQFHHVSPSSYRSICILMDSDNKGK